MVIANKIKFTKNTTIHTQLIVNIALRMKPNEV